VHTQDNQAGTPQGVAAQIVTMPISHRQGFTTQDFTAQGFTRQDFTTAGFADRASANQGFTTEDVLWALGIWSVIICLSPVIVFYMLMVA
jgi:hypothetical protein